MFAAFLALLFSIVDLGKGDGVSLQREQIGKFQLLLIQTENLAYHFLWYLRYWRDLDLFPAQYLEALNTP